MQRDFQLIRRVLVDPAFNNAIHEVHFDSEYFTYYSIELSLTRYRGFPPHWGFAVLRPGQKGRDQTSITDDSIKLIRKLPESTSLLLISDSPAIHLEDNISFKGRNVFCLDANDLPEQGHEQALAPLRRAIRRRLNNDQIATFFRLVPYQKGDPARDWRFYGRRKELDQLLDSPQSFVIVGGRRIGKTSLMMETQKRLKERGETAHYLSVEECRSGAEVVNKLLATLAPRDRAAAVTRTEVLGEKMLTSVLKRIAAQGKVTLLLDELGNVLVNLPPEDWNFLGVLRQLAQQNKIRFIISCFHEFFLLRQQEFSGPLINFATTLRLGAFPRSEAEDLFIPLEWWTAAGQERAQARDRALANIGRHPLFLQTFCYDLFTRVARGDSIAASTDILLGKDLATFRGPMDEVFWIRDSATVNYLFLKRCYEIEKAGQKLGHVEITEEWVRGSLREVGFQATTLDFRNLLEAMELRGFTSRPDGTTYGDRQVVVAPIVYFYFKKTEPDLARLLKRLAEDISTEQALWNLHSVSRGDHAQP